MNILDLIPLPIAFGMVLYVDKKIKEHSKECTIHNKLEDMHEDIRELRKALIREKI